MNNVRHLDARSEAIYLLRAAKLMLKYSGAVWGKHELMDRIDEFLEREINPELRQAQGGQR